MAIELHVADDPVLRPAVNKGAIEMISALAERRGYKIRDGEIRALVSLDPDELRQLMLEIDYSTEPAGIIRVALDKGVAYDM